MIRWTILDPFLCLGDNQSLKLQLPGVCAHLLSILWSSTRLLELLLGMIPVNQHHLGSAPRNSRASHGTPPRLPALRRASIRGFPRAGEARLGESPKPEQVGSLTSSHHPKNAPFTTRLVPQNHRDLMWRVQPAPTERRVHGHICARSLHRFKSILILDLLPAGALLASWIDAKIDTRKQSHGSGNWPGLRTFRFLAESSCPRNSKTLGSPSCWSPRKTSGTLLIDQTPNLFWGFTIQMEGGLLLQPTYTICP